MGTDLDLCYLSATEALARFAAGTLSPVELLDALVARADEVEPTINAWCARRLDRAYTDARASQERWAAGTALALDGLPVAFKEEQPIAGESWQMASLTYEGQVADITHPLYERVTAAGGVVHARTATPEFSCAGFTHSKLWGVTRNPWNTDYTPGGSSGGAGAALASGTATLATGSDIGGSIRLPASLSGVVGFKPPHGRVPTLPPFNLDHYNHDGPMARTVADLALLQNVIAGPHPIDHVSMLNPPHLAPDAGRAVGMRVALATTLGNFPVDDEVVANTRAFGAALRGAGVEVTEVTVEIDFESSLRAAMIHFGAIFGAYVAGVDAEHPGMVMPYARDFGRRSGEAFAANGVLAGLEAEIVVHAAFAQALAGVDALVCPTLGTVGWLAGIDYVDETLLVAGVEYDDYFAGAQTFPLNIASKHPVVAVPSGRASNGVPTGVQLVGHTYDDATPFHIAALAERELGWWNDPSWRPAC